MYLSDMFKSFMFNYKMVENKLLLCFVQIYRCADQTTISMDAQ